MKFFEKFTENLFIKFPGYIRVLLWVLLIILICCDILSLVKTGSLAVEPAIYALIFISICIDEVRDTRNEIISEIKTILGSKIVKSSKPDSKSETE